MKNRTYRFVMLALGVLVTLLVFGCALRSENLKFGKLRDNPQYSQDMRNHTLIPGYRYYFAGFAVRPLAVLGLHPDWTLDTKTVAYLWEPVDHVEDVPKMIKNLDRGRSFYPSSASDVLDDEGNSIGAYYSKCGNVSVFITRNIGEVFIDGSCLQYHGGGESYDSNDSNGSAD